MLRSTRKYLFALIQYPGKASILVSTIQCYTKLIFEFTQKIHAQNSVWLGSFFLTDQGLHLGLENGHLWITKYLFYKSCWTWYLHFLSPKWLEKIRLLQKHSQLWSKSKLFLTNEHTVMQASDKKKNIINQVILCWCNTKFSKNKCTRLCKEIWEVYQ